jgi:hypothetical protein
MLLNSESTTTKNKIATNILLENEKSAISPLLEKSIKIKFNYIYFDLNIKRISFNFYL